MNEIRGSDRGDWIFNVPVYILSQYVLPLICRKFCPSNLSPLLAIKFPMIILTLVI